MTTDMTTPASTGERERINRAETCRRLGISTTTLHRYITRGHLHPIRATIGQGVWYHADEVERVRRARLGLEPVEVTG